MKKQKQKHITTAYKVFRAFLMVVLLSVIVLPTALYVALSLPSVQNKIRLTAQEELSKLLDADVTIEDLGIRPFNRAVLRRISVVESGDTVLKVDRIGAGINIYELLFGDRIAFSYAEIIRPQIWIHRDSDSAPLNIQPIIDRLSKKDENKPPSRFDVRVNTLVLRRGRLNYDVLDKAETPDHFNPDHIAIANLNADISMPRLSNENFDVDLKRLSFSDVSGFSISNISGHVSATPERISWSGVDFSMPRSQLLFADGTLALNDVVGSSDSIFGANVEIKNGSHLYLPDFKAFSDVVADLATTINVNLRGNISPTELSIDRFTLSDSQGMAMLWIEDGKLCDFNDMEKLRFELKQIELSAGGPLLSHLKRKGVLHAQKFENIEGAALIASASGNALHGKIKGDATLNDGQGGYLTLDAVYSRNKIDAPFRIKGTVKADAFDLATSFNNPEFGVLNAEVDADLILSRHMINGEATVTVDDFAYRGHTYDNLTAKVSYSNGDYSGTVRLADEAANVDADFSGSVRKGSPHLKADLAIDGVDFNALRLTDKYEGYTLSLTSEIDVAGAKADRIDGFVKLRDISFVNPEAKSFSLDSISLTSRSSEYPRSISLDSELLSGEISGDYDFRSLIPAVREIFYSSFPALRPENEPEVKNNLLALNKFAYNFHLNDTELMADFFNLPVSVIYPMTIDGTFDSRRRYATFNLDAPYIRQKTKIIDNTSIMAIFDGAKGRDELYMTTTMPTNDGGMALVMNMTGADNHVGLNVDWEIDRKKKYNGGVSIDTDISLLDNRKLLADISLNRSELVFNDSVWTINPAKIRVEGTDRIYVDDLNVHRSNQFVKINGVASRSDADTLRVDVLNLSLDYLFETLNIDAVMLAGDATGQITASSLLSSEPHLVTKGIDVKGIGYNKCIFGDAVVKSYWDMQQKAVVIDGTINQYNGHTAKVQGEIFPTKSSLDLRLKTDKTPVGFMQKYMGAFASDITGLASGEARLYGTFHDIDMKGDVFVDDLQLKLNFTNTYFRATDSIKIVPGKIILDNITISDLDGNSALLNGELTHDFFRDPTFNFEISDAKQMLVYDETSKDNPDWYGKIFVNGGARIIGRPGLVAIDVEASTAANSTFTFVLSEKEIADDYTFLAFRDKDKPTIEIKDVIEDRNMRLVNHFRALNENRDAAGKTDYVIDLRVGITRQASIGLVMDPRSGDKINSNGTGDLRLVYRSNDNDLQMFGSYTLENGTYNFSLQDIIHKDFIIKQGSTITFNGDPMAARLDVSAYNQLHANLSDLDESFLQDKELNRTNVEVRALLLVKGDIRQPQISFDLEFPTLRSDVYNKVRSIISTEEMMNRQIIYLLALNRFYTPDYMGSTTKGNELFSVASSTLTSQMSNILGRLSDNWTVSPNLRSDRGDFSDVEVDVALSSRLLNNRLLLNGNFGYRDKSLNSNQFIGDFDIEYLLNRSGTIRLKAYSHSNDENYYVRSAATTQGVGVMYKQDFDNIFSFLKRKHKPTEVVPTDTTTVPADSLIIEVTDSVFIAPLPSSSERYGDD